MPRRAVIIVLDSVGIGELPDAHLFGDEGSNTLGNLSRAFPDGLRLPNMAKLGLGNIAELRGVPPDPQAIGGWGKCAEKSMAKDTTLGHWEIAGIISEKPFPTYPNGFPPEIIQEFERRIGRGTLGNIPASGTEIIQKLGDEHVRTGKPIVYTSADSVFQIAAHEEVIPLEELYEMCRIARELLDGPHRVGRVIARPFIGTSGNYTRTRNRRDFSVPPPRPTILDRLKENGYAVIGVGKIGDIFAHTGLTHEIHTGANEKGILATLVQLNEAPDGLIFTNLVDTDMIYGHRNDTVGYRASLEEFDSYLPKILSALQPEDLLIITADHGCDPTTPSTDHSREYVPLLVYSKAMPHGVNLGTRETFADTAATIAEFFNIAWDGPGTSYLRQVLPQP
ncbi:Phosphopentomutase [Candidatus Sumerlaea chitinivorans]|uniref:Phosphopentomutase n=1 Tax=Sumerlaea chitinivorans TaxID=2250252 RepID=A0A2Z4Y2I3_SUMC1|nr:Phosphopentomutase [Candidatus Sumerlaea chitinivorans]